MTREKAIIKKAEQLVRGAWSSIHSYVDRTLSDDEREEDEDQDEMGGENE